MDYSSDKIVLNFYTNQQYVLDQCKPQLAKKWIPEWWKKLPASRTEIAGELESRERTSPHFSECS